jgi:hypothetical protein
MGHRCPLGSGSAGQGQQRPLRQQAIGIGGAGFRATGPGPCAAGPVHMPTVDLEATLGHGMGVGGVGKEGGPDHAYATASTFRASRGPILQRAETQLSVESDYSQTTKLMKKLQLKGILL